jgi:integral membrane protein (TIGR01906 family)
LIYDSDFYTELTEEYSSIDALQMNKDMIEYFKTGIAPASFLGFSEKELVHLKDVRCVIQYLLGALMISVVLFVFLLRFAKDRRKIFFYGGIITIVLPILFFLPFDLLFTQMHNLFFEPGSWVFPPDALLVNLYPVQFFFSFAKSIILGGFCLGLVITTFSSKLYSLLQ